MAVSAPTMKDYLEAQIAFEKTSHDAIYKWTATRSGFPADKTDLDILDLSIDGATFSQILADSVKARKLVIAVRRDPQDEDVVPALSENSGVAVEVVVIDISAEDKSFESMTNLGKFDLIILKEMLFEVKDLHAFFVALKSNLKHLEESRVFAVARPKNPPVPLPDPAMMAWRKMTPSREEIIVAGQSAGFKQDFYAASCPIRIDRNQWSRVLHSKCLAAVRNSPKCTDKEIRDFISTRPATMNFEEKIFIIVLWLEGDGGTLKDATPIGSEKNLIDCE